MTATFVFFTPNGQNVNSLVASHRFDGFSELSCVFAYEVGLFFVLFELKPSSFIFTIVSLPCFFCLISPSHPKQSEMDSRVGPKATGYLTPEAFEEHETLCRSGSFGVFDTMATMGRRSEIVRVRSLLLDELNDAKIRYTSICAQWIL